MTFRTKYEINCVKAEERMTKEEKGKVLSIKRPLHH